jgi:quinol monooxygenase YgiN
MAVRTCAVLGFQTALSGAGPHLAELNLRLGEALDAEGLLRFQVLVHATDADRICVYWLWRDIRDRDALWAAPPTALTDFWAAARPHWSAEPSVRRFSWQPAVDRDLCAPGGSIAVEEAPRPTGEAAGAWLLDTDGPTALRCRPPSGPGDPAAWRALGPSGKR